METNKLYTILSTVGKVYSRNWDTVREIVAAYPESATLSKEWYDRFKKDNPKWYPLDLSRIETWSTYSECVSLIFEVKGSDLYCKAQVYDGDNMYGLLIGLRFEAELLLPRSFIHKIEHAIQSEFSCWLNDRYDDHLEETRRLWVEEKRAEVLNSSNL